MAFDMYDSVATICKVESNGMYLTVTMTSPVYARPLMIRVYYTPRSIRHFRIFCADIEKSNPGYIWSWDVDSLIGKRIGVHTGLDGKLEFCAANRCFDPITLPF